MNRKLIFIVSGFLISFSFVVYLNTKVPEINIDKTINYNINKEMVYQNIKNMYPVDAIPSFIEFPEVTYKLDDKKLEEYIRKKILLLGKVNPMKKVEVQVNDIVPTNDVNNETSNNINNNTNTNTVLKDLQIGDIPITPIDKDKFIISSKFGIRVVKDFYNGQPHLHRGIDLACPEGTEIKVPLDGEVIDAFTQEEGGNILVIKHNEHVITLYAHLKEFKVKKGDKVKKGQIIALSGNTGKYTTGPHLHFELRFDDTPINPEEYIDFSK